MATSEDEEKQNVADLSKTLKEGERILAPTRRPDGTLRKPIRIRAGYVPQEEVAIYQPKPALLRKELASHAGPPGYDPELDPKPKTKAVKRNERKKEKRLQASLEKEKSSEPSSSDHTSESVHSLASQMNELAVSGNSSIVTPDADSVEGSEPIGSGQDIEKRIRALKKKIRLTEALQQKTAGQDMKPEQLEKLAKLEDWRKELKLLEDKKAEAPAA
ncbi:partner of Y14 and mago isoform X2 [Gastrolobium bilobum]|uniref:partner of Y14 and mago isoform X2 n=1 Tax=Gastrolobium bilobum TaxID=150636 RepID=UPI002AB23D6F|nr:partner of Y14 and mago isoform X2 [Gastrolobium bilobum]